MAVFYYLKNFKIIFEKYLTKGKAYVKMVLPTARVVE